MHHNNYLSGGVYRTLGISRIINHFYYYYYYHYYWLCTTTDLGTVALTAAILQILYSIYSQCTFYTDPYFLLYSNTYFQYFQLTLICLHLLYCTEFFTTLLFVCYKFSHLIHLVCEKLQEFIYYEANTCS